MNEYNGKRDEENAHSVVWRPLPLRGTATTTATTATTATIRDRRPSNRFAHINRIFSRNGSDRSTSLWNATGIGEKNPINGPGNGPSRRICKWEGLVLTLWVVTSRGPAIQRQQHRNWKPFFLVFNRGKWSISASNSSGKLWNWGVKSVNYGDFIFKFPTANSVWISKYYLHVSFWQVFDVVTRFRDEWVSIQSKAGDGGWW